MATYRIIAATETDPLSPITATLMDAIANNPTAMAEGATGAPKIALKSASGSFTSSALDFGSLDAWSGVWLSCTAYNSGASSSNIDIYVTNDAFSTLLGGVTIHSLGPGTAVTIAGFLDFATGIIHGTYAEGSLAGVFSQTIAGASVAINGVRFPNSSGVSGGVMIHPNGGESAT